MSMSIPRIFSETGVTLYRDGGVVRFEVHNTGVSGRIDEVLPVLEESVSGGLVVLSAWEDIPEIRDVIKILRKNKITPGACFVPAENDSAWRRKNLVKRAWSDVVVSGTPEFIRALITPKTENLVKMPPFEKEVRFITIHNTAEPFSAATERCRVEFRSGSRVSFHFAVDEKSIVQLLPLDCHGWHAGDGEGCGNTQSIGIEICRSSFYGINSHLYRRAQENAAALAAALLKRFSLKNDALCMHRDWSGKYCPHRILEENSWIDFCCRVAALRSKGNHLPEELLS